VSPQNSRKTFLAQLLGLFAGIGLAPKLFSKTAPAGSGEKAAPVVVQTEQRAVARRADTV
jgi:hypothetical protein